MHRILLSALIASLVVSASAQPKKPPPEGYSDTPKLPHVDWKVHDIDRPPPKVVQPGATDDAPPADAIVLFDGGKLDAWRKKDGSAAHWKVQDGHMEVVYGGDIFTKQEFGSCQLHVEWRSPTPPQSSSQKRGNSGIFLMDRYEIQVLDGHDNKTYSDGRPGAVYGQYAPLVNVCRKPGEWQSYDIIFTAPKWVDGKIDRKARVTVLHNGVLVQNSVELLGPSQHKRVANWNKPHPEKVSIRLQDHKDKQQVRFRNIWIRELE